MSGRRALVCLLLLLLAFGGLVARASALVVRDGDRLARLAARQSSRDIEVAPRRGALYDRDGAALALSIEVESIYARPARLRSREVAPLAAALGLSAGELRSRLEASRPFVWLRRQASAEVAARVRALDLPAVGFVTEHKRVYPNGTLAGQLIGFAGLDGQGLEGVERAFDGVIRGDVAHRAEGRDARGRRLLPDGIDPHAVAPEGAGLVLTIDRLLQFAAEEALERAVADAGAAGGSALVLDPESGEVLALSSAPAFDPNRFPRARPDAWRLRAVTDAFEPGSTVKVFLAAAALEDAVVRLDERFYAERGAYHLGRRLVRDVHASEWLTLPEILQVSSNIGAIKVADRVGAERYRRMLGAFGFGARTGIALPGEAEGTLRPASAWSRVSLATASYGYGLTATPIQLAVAFATIANDGVAVAPRIARGTLLTDGRTLGGSPPRAVRRVIAPPTARRLTSMLEAAVAPGGTGERAALPGYAVAGKTGTARKVEERGGYARDRYVASFVGFVPARAPRFVIAVFVDEPRSSIYGGVVAAPAFRAIAEAALAAYRVPPTPGAGAPARRPPPRRPPVVLAAAGTGPGPRTLEEAGGGAPVLPDFTGLGLREALDLGRAYGLVVEVEGNGWAVDQRPAAGAPWPRDARVAVSFTP